MQNTTLYIEPLSEFKILIESAEVKLPILHLPSATVVDFDRYSKLAQFMEQVVRTRAQGLSAPQCGVLKRIFTFKWGLDIITLFNPELVKASTDMYLSAEGCLSLPGLLYEIHRPLTIKLRGFTVQGTPRIFKAHHEAVLFHELDHLKGITVQDRWLEEHK